MLWPKRNLRASNEVHVVRGVNAPGLVVEHAHVQVTESFRDEHPHGLDAHLDGTVELLPLNAKQELGRLSRLKLLRIGSGRNPKGLGRLGVPILCGLQRPEVDSEGRKSHVRRLRRLGRTDRRFSSGRRQRFKKAASARDLGLRGAAGWSPPLVRVSRIDDVSPRLAGDEVSCWRAAG